VILLGAYETKLIVSLMARAVAKSKTVKEAYTAIAESARVEGFSLPTYEEAINEANKKSDE
jgi:hypothetical protein